MGMCWEKSEVPLRSGEMNHEFLITAIPGITIISCSVSCCLAEVRPRRKCKKTLLILQLNLQEVQRREQLWRRGKEGTGRCPQQGRCELSVPHVLKLMDTFFLFIVFCYSSSVCSKFWVTFINLFLTSFSHLVSFRTNASFGFLAVEILTNRISCNSGSLGFIN